MATETKQQAASPLPSHDLLSWEEAAAYLGPSFTARWVRRQVYKFRRINAPLVGGRRMVPRSELDRLVREGMTQGGQ